MKNYFTIVIMTAANLAAFFVPAMTGSPLTGLLMIGLCLLSFYLGSKQQQDRESSPFYTPNDPYESSNKSNPRR